MKGLRAVAEEGGIPFGKVQASFVEDGQMGDEGDGDFTFLVDEDLQLYKKVPIGETLSTPKRVVVHGPLRFAEIRRRIYAPLGLMASPRIGIAACADKMNLSERRYARRSLFLSHVRSLATCSSTRLRGCLSDAVVNGPPGLRQLGPDRVAHSPRSGGLRAYKPLVCLVSRTQAALYAARIAR